MDGPIPKNHLKKKWAPKFLFFNEKKKKDF